MTIAVRDLQPEDEAGFLRLWGDYLTFYGKSLAADVTARTWARILDSASPMFARIAKRDGRLAGFAVCVLHDASWHRAPICYLEDLFVDEAQRGGVGKALIDDLAALGRQRGWAKLYWHTEVDNVRARRLYDRYRGADDYVRYTLILD